MRPRPSPTECGRKTCVAPPAAEIIAFALDHYLPAPFTFVAAVGLLEERQPPVLEHVHGRIDVARDVIDEIFATEPHQVLAHVADEVLRLILAPLHPHVAVDRRKPHRNGSAALDRRLLDQYDAQALGLGPIRGLVCGAASGHSAAANQNVALDDFDFRLDHLDDVSAVTEAN